MSIKPLSDYDLLPVYMRVAEDLRSKLGTQGFEFGLYLPGEHEIATQYNLSRGTIRRALGILEKEGLLSRQPGRGTLILPPSSHELGTRSKIAVVWTMLRWMGMEMFSALEEHLSTANCDILFRSSKHDPKKESKILTNLLDSDVDAIVLYSTGHPENYPLIQQLQNQGKPVVLLDRFVQDQTNKLSWVTSENEQGAYTITRHLIELGHKRIGMSILTPEHQYERINTIVEREKGYVKAINEAGLESFLMKEYCTLDGTSADFGKELIKFIVSRQPTAIFFHNDASAYRMHAILNQNGIQVPQDISIAGFDGLDLFYDLLSFDLTTVQQDFASLGEQAAKLVLSLLQDPNYDSRQIRLPVKLRVGNTTAPPQEVSDIMV
ncbi:MAG: GntR family transcriptional regulator [Chloroflexi bacterium]|nr:GntR family transcriptional regulator [Chloroflexota bacterium]